MTAAVRVAGWWWQDAACRPGTLPTSVHPAWFDSDAHPEDRAAALRICATCPVTDSCLADALSNGDSGTRGGQFLPAVGKVRVCKACPAQFIGATAQAYCERCRFPADSQPAPAHGACARPGCGERLTGRRRKWCSNRCADAVAQQLARQRSAIREAQ